MKQRTAKNRKARTRATDTQSTANASAKQGRIPKKPLRFIKTACIWLALVCFVFLLFPMACSAFTTVPFGYIAQWSMALRQSAWKTTDSISALQSGSSETESTSGQTAESGIRSETDIVYGQSYANSTLDILYADTEDAPLFVFVHGGGAISGDKTDNDFAPLTEAIRARGYHVVTLNYALLPEGTFPVPVRQLEEALLFLYENQSVYGINMENFVLMGQSSGGSLVAQYVAALSEPEYAASLGLQTKGDSPAPAAVILDDPPLDVANMYWQMKLIIGNYIAGRTVLTEEEIEMYDAARHFTPDFPPCFILVSYRYEEDDLRIANLLTEQGVTNELFDPYAATGEKTRHCFINSADETDLGAGAIDAMLAFTSGYIQTNNAD